MWCMFDCPVDGQGAPISPLDSNWVKQQTVSVQVHNVNRRNRIVCFLQDVGWYDKEASPQPNGGQQKC